MTAQITYQDRIPFVYIVGWSEEGVYYIGSRTARGCSPSDIGTTYFTSSKVVRQKWGESPPDIVQVLMTFTTKEAAIEFEYTALMNLDAHKTPQLLNRTIGGKKFVGGVMSDTTRAKISAAHKGKVVSDETRAKLSVAKQNISDKTRAKMSAAKQNISDKTRAKMSAAKRNISDKTRAKLSTVNAGRKRSLETRAKLSTVNAGRKRSLETRAKMSAAKQNMSEETRAKMSAARQNISEETRAKISAANKGKTRSEETRAKIADANKGKTLLTTTRARISAARKAYWAKRRAQSNLDTQA